MVHRACLCSSNGGRLWDGWLRYVYDLAGYVFHCSSYSAAFDTPEQIRTSLQDLRKRLSIPSDAPIPIGVGLVGWVLDKTEVTEEPMIPAVLAERPKAVWFAFGNDLGQYVRQVRAYDATRDHKTLVFVCVNTTEEAKIAAEDWKVDVLVAQGTFL